MLDVSKPPSSSRCSDCWLISVDVLFWVLLYILFFLIWRLFSSQTTSIYVSINFIEVLIFFTNLQPPEKCQQKHFHTFPGCFLFVKRSTERSCQRQAESVWVPSIPRPRRNSTPWKLKHPQYWWLEDDIFCSNGTYAGELWFLFWGNHQHVVKGSVNMKSSNVAKKHVTFR